jgi:hypothetical protein
LGRQLSEQGIQSLVAGGWALDMFLERLTRPHADVDLMIWRDQQLALRAALHDWTFAVADGGVLRPWTDGAALRLPLHEIHASSPTGQSVEFLLNDREAGSWVYRRDPRVRRDLTRAVLRRGDLSILAPEIVLLYKSKAPRPSDVADFQVTVTALDDERRAWLREALAVTTPGHSWIAETTD